MFKPRQFVSFSLNFFGTSKLSFALRTSLGPFLPVFHEFSYEENLPETVNLFLKIMEIYLYSLLSIVFSGISSFELFVKFNFPELNFLSYKFKHNEPA